MSGDDNPLPLSPATRRKLERYLRKRFLIAPHTSLEDMCRAHPEAAAAWFDEQNDKSKRAVELAKHEYAIAEVELALIVTWSEDEQAKGRPESELTFGNCVRELGVLVIEPDGSQRIALDRLLDWPDRPAGCGRRGTPAPIRRSSRRKPRNSSAASGPRNDRAGPGRRGPPIDSVDAVSRRGDQEGVQRSNDRPWVARTQRAGNRLALQGLRGSLSDAARASRGGPARFSALLRGVI